VRPTIAAAALVIMTAGITHYVTRSAYEKPTAVAATTRPPSVPGPAVTSPESIVTPTPQVATNNPVTPPTPSSGDASSGSNMGQSGAQKSAGRTPIEVASNAARSTPRTSAARLVRAEGLIDATEPVYDKEISKLRTIVRSRRADLDPRTIAVLEQSIAVIDSAIAQSRSALAKDPASGFLANQLNHSLEKKVELLRTAAMLPART
jgi:hypothetical protein